MSKDFPKDFRETLYTVDSSGKRKWVYPQVVTGRFSRIRKVVVTALMLILFALPWLTINGKQAVLLKIAERKFIFFGLTFWATDTFYLMLILGLLAISLFFFTSLFGRVWCGWACPQTVFLEFLFRPLEALIEGNASKRKKLDESDWNFEKIYKKSLKYSVFSLFAWFLASTILAYFVGREPLLEMMTHSPFENLTPFIATLFLSGVTLFQFGWFREQFCTVVCPYARFQSVLLDSNSIVIGYDQTRGEPRGKDKTAGDCIDCGLCVRVCPTGIDIRNGLQLECIQCTACIDACDSIMDNLDRPRGLIRYATEKALLGEPSKLIRPRVVLYGTALLLYAFLIIFSLSNRQTAEFQIIRSVGAMPYSLTSEGKVINPYKIHLANKSDFLQHFRVASDEQELELILPGSPFPVAPGSSNEVPIMVTVPKSSLLDGKREITIKVFSDQGLINESKITVLGPE
jgi:cytochrome c oxidase accessory protein FixG